VVSAERAFAALVACVLAGCRAEASPPGSCMRDRDGACTEYPGDRAAAGKRMCAGFTWREGAGSCPAEGRLGTCAKEAGRVVEILYAGPPNHFTAATAQGACTGAGGQWAGATR